MAPRRVYRAVIDPYSRRETGVEVMTALCIGKLPLFPTNNEFYARIDNADEVLEHFEKLNHNLLGAIVGDRREGIYFVSVKETESGVSVYVTKALYDEYLEYEGYSKKIAYKVFRVDLDTLEQVEELNFKTPSTYRTRT